MDRELLQSKLAEYTFYQTIDLGDGVKTPGRPLGEKQKEVLKLIDLKGKRVVDLGCANGLFVLAAEKRGAEEVIAVDHATKNIEALENIIIPHLNSNIKTMTLNVLDFDSEAYGKFDLVIFAGLLYHLRYPFWALKVVRDLLHDRATVIVETGIYEDFNTNSLLYCPIPADSNPNSLCGHPYSYFNEKALLETLEYFGIKVHSQVVVTGPLRRLAKKLFGKYFDWYGPLSNIVL